MGKKGSAKRVPYSIREYKDSDWVHVERVFAEGVWDMVPRLTHLMYTVDGPILACLVGLVVYVLSSSIVWTAMGAASSYGAFASGVQRRSRYLMGQLIQMGLDSDMRDPTQHYINTPGNNFWVAAVPGEDGKSEQIIGILAVQRHTDGKLQ